ncbi:MAG: hypothetical protein ACE5HB_09335 [Terriglobia bacterium]
MIRTAEPELAGMGPLIVGSDLIVVGQVVGERARLSHDASTVFTDYTIEIDDVLVDVQQRAAPGQRLIAARSGGHLLVDGVAVHVESIDFPPLSWLVPYVFFLKAEEDGYRFWGGAQGVWEIRKGRVRSHLPKKVKLPVRNLYNKYKTKSFFEWVRGTGGRAAKPAAARKEPERKPKDTSAPGSQASLLEAAKAGGRAQRTIRPATMTFHGLRQRRAASDLVVRGRVIGQTTTLSEDGSQLRTDYTLDVIDVLMAGGSGQGSSTLRVRVPGGNLLREDLVISVANELFPPLPWVREHVFFLLRDAHEEGLYRFLGGAQGAFRRDHNNRTRCHLPKQAWEFLCRSRDGGPWQSLLNDLQEKY